ncbi:MAG: hypothetical protein ABIH26_04745 [Candidatus Eisenbacteria bacterium]
MTLELKKVAPAALRSFGLDEKWLQDRIAEDPSLLGLGDLHVIRREKSQPSGGRIDFLMYDPEGDTRYEIEVMLGTLDESHIIRTIEYWDIERQRYPTLDHRAVIVAEEITSRFFNVIRLLNRAVPMIALQLSAFRFGDHIVLHFTKVLDVYEFPDEEEDSGAEQTDRKYWEKRANASSLSIVDVIVGLLPSGGAAPRVTYNKGHIALGTEGYNFCWFHPRRASTHCHIHMRVGNEQRDDLLRRLEEAGISAGTHRRDAIKLKLTPKELEENRDLIGDIAQLCEKLSKS